MSAIGSLRTVNTTLIPVDVVNANNRCYPADTLKQAVTKMPPEMIGTVGYVARPTLDDAAFKATGFALNERGDLTGQIEVLDTPSGKKLMEMIKEGKVTFRTSGVGNLDGNKVVDFEINALAAIPKTEDAFGSAGTL